MFDAYRKWLGIPPKDQPPNHYRLLGVELFETDLDVIEGAADRQMAFVRQYQSGEHAAEAAKILNELATARLCLLKPATKQAYDAKLREQSAPADTSPFDLPLDESDLKPLSSMPRRKKSSKSQSAGFPKPLVIGGGIAVAAAIVIAIFASGRQKPVNVPANPERVADAEARTVRETGSTATPSTAVRPESKLAAEPAGPAVDLLQQIDLNRDVIAGEWQQAKTTLIGGFHGRMYLPAKLPEDYQVKLTARASEGADTLMIGFMMAGRQGSLVLDGWGATFSGLYLDGLEPTNNCTTWRGKLFTKGTSTIVMTVHPGHLHLTFDNQTVIDWHGDPDRLFVASAWGMGSRESLMLALVQCKYVFESASLTPIRPEPALKPLKKLDHDIEVIPLLDFDRDSFQGIWGIQKKALYSPETIGKIAFPLEVPEEYTFSAQVELPAENRAEPTMIVGLPWSGRQCQIVLKNDECIGIELIDGRRFQHTSSRRTGTYLKPGVPAKMDCTVTKAGIRMEIDGRTLIDWRGEPWRVSTTGDWIPADARKLSMGTKCHFKLRDIKIGPPISPAAVPAHAPLTVGTPLDLLTVIDPNRDSLSGKWEGKDDKLRILDETGLSRLVIPFEVPLEYKLIMRVAREGAGEGKQLHVSLPVGKSEAVFNFDEGPNSGVYLDHQGLDNNVTWRKPVLSEAPIDLTFWVRQTGFKVMRGAETIIDWTGNPDRLTWHHDLTTPGPRIALGSWKQRLRFNKLTIEPLEPIAIPPVEPLGSEGKLLPIINAARDAVIGEWKQDSDSVTCSDLGASRLNLPAPVPKKYVLSGTVQRMAGSRQLWFGLVVDGHPCSIALDEEHGQRLGVELLDGKRSFDGTNLTLRKYSPPLFPPGQSVPVRCVVLPDSIVVTCGDKEVVRWHGDPRRLSALIESTPPNCTKADRDSLWVGGWESRFIFRDLELKALADDEADTIAKSFTDVFPLTPQVDVPFAKVSSDFESPDSPSANAPQTPDSPLPTSSAKTGEWVDLLDWCEGLDWSSSGINWNDKISGNPMRTGIRTKTIPFARFPLSAILDGDYELEFEFKRLSGVEAIAIYFPVGLHTMRMLLGANGGRQSHVAYIAGKEFGHQHGPAAISNGESHRVIIRVHRDGAKAAFNVDFDNVKDYFQWEGDYVDLLDIDESEWGTYMLRRPWVGSASCDVIFQRIRLRMQSGTVRRDPMTDADREQDLKNGLVRLVGEQAQSISVGAWRFTVNQTPAELAGLGCECRWPLITPDFKFCDNFYGAHPPSSLKLAIPKGSKSFSTIGYNDASRRTKFHVYIDGELIYDSKQTPIAVIKIDLPAKGTLLELVVDPAGDTAYDHAFWCYPRFHNMAADQVTDKMLDDKRPQPKYIQASTAEFGPTFNKLYSSLQSKPVQFRDALPCDEFLMAHAPSSAMYQVPQNMTRFTAIGYNVISHSAKYEVWADRKKIYESPQAGIVKIDVKLPPGTKSIELKTTDVNGGAGDQCFWCYPRLHRK